MSGVQIPVEAKFDSSDVDQALQKLTSQINQMGHAIAQANKVKFTPVDKTTLSDLQKVTQQFDSLRKISGDLNKRMKDTGQGSSGFFDIDYSKIYADPSMRARQMRNQFDYVAAGTGAGFYTPAMPSQPGASPVVPPSPPPAPSPPPSPGSTWGRAGRNVVSSGLKAAGPVGSVADGAISDGLGGGMAAGLAGLAGGIVALGIGKAIGAVREKIGAAQQEDIGYDTLKRTLGDVNVNFNVLKESLRNTSSSLDLTYSEGQKLGTEFAKIANISSEQYKTLAGEVKVGGGFGRSFGVDPGQSNAFFAQMRQFHVTTDENGSRRLALMIGESIEKSGAVAKADEMLQSIASFTAQQTRMGMNSANVSGYASMLSGAVKSGIPGLDVQGASNLISKMNSSIASGGSAGEAGQNLMWSAVGRPLGLTPIESNLQLQQGAFGTGRSTFGEGSLAAKWMKENHIAIPKSAAESDKTNIEMIMEQLHKQFGANPSMKEIGLSGAGNLFGFNETQMMAASLIKPETFGALQKRLTGKNGKLSDYNDNAILDMAKIEDDSTKTDAEKQKLISGFARNGQESTVGSDTRASKVALENLAQDIAGKLIPAVNTMRDGILHLAGGGKKSSSEVIADIANLEYKEKIAPIKERKDHLQSLLDLPLTRRNTGGKEALAKRNQSYRDEIKQLNGQIDKAAGERDAEIKGVTPGVDEKSSMLSGLADTDRMLNLTPGTSAAMINQESGFKTGRVSNKGALGLPQVLPAQLAEVERRLRRKLNPDDPNDAVLIQRELMRENMKQWGNEDDAVRAYNGGWDPKKWNNPETNHYLAAVKQTATSFGTPLPPGSASRDAQGKQQTAVDLNLTLQHQYPNGAPVADPQVISKTIGVPNPYGTPQ